MKDNEYRCDCCHKKFIRGWTEEEARKEEEKVFGRNDPDAGIVCDECYAAIMREFAPEISAEDAVHFEFTKPVKGKLKCVILCGVSGVREEKRTPFPENITCPHCRKQYMKRVSALVKGRVKEFTAKIPEALRNPVE